MVDMNDCFVLYLNFINLLKPSPVLCVVLSGIDVFILFFFSFEHFSTPFSTN